MKQEFLQSFNTAESWLIKSYSEMYAIAHIEGWV